MAQKKSEYCCTCEYWFQDDPNEFYIDPREGLCEFLPGGEHTGEYEWCHQYKCKERLKGKFVKYSPVKWERKHIKDKELSNVG